MMNGRSLFLALASIVPFVYVIADVPQPVAALIAEMRETGSTVRGGVSPELGIFIVGIGHARYREDDVSLSREIAEANAKKQLTSALEQSFKARDAVALQMTVENDKAEASAFVSSLTESSVNQLLKGLQMASSGKNAQGEMEVVMYLTAKMQDRTSDLVAAQMQWGDKGVVAAVGIDVERAIAEKNALRSAVEQVAGTLVVGKVSVNEREEMHKRLATTAGALVEEYRITKETKVEAEFRVEILARVNKRKLYDSYRSYFKCLDNPTFCIVATDRALIRQFSQFFADKGFSLTNDPSDCQYLIKLDGRFRDRPTPGNPQSMGTMLALNIEIVSVDGTKTLLTMNERQAKDSEVLTREQRIEEVSRRIFNKLETRLHKAIQDMVVRMLDEADTQAAPVVDSGTTF